MEFNSFDINIQSDEFIPNGIEEFFEFDYEQWLEDCENAPEHKGGIDTTLFG